VLAGFESSGIGVNHETAGELYDNYTYRRGLILLACSGVLFTLVGLYLDKVLPKEYGQRYPVYFLCMPSFWGCSRPRGREIDDEER